MKEKGFGKNQADNSLTSCAIYKRDRAVERCSELFMTFREVLLIGGENVKTQVQQLNEGVSSQRDSLSKCMCANNHTFSKPKFKKKATPLEIWASSLYNKRYPFVSQRALEILISNNFCAAYVQAG